MAISTSPRRLPGWVLIAGMIVALLIAGIIMATVLRPIYNLVFPGKASAPIPPGAVELEYKEPSRFSDGEWLYGSDMPGCEVVQFYIKQGSTCKIAPLACGETNQALAGGIGETANSLQTIATCEGTRAAVVASHSWLVDISGGYNDEYPTRFRVYLFKERD